MPFTNYTNLDFDQIKTSIKDYLRANSEFSDFDFEGSNFAVLIDALAYNTYITAFNANMAVNESFIESATLRENVVSLDLEMLDMFQDLRNLPSLKSHLPLNLLERVKL